MFVKDFDNAAVSIIHFVCLIIVSNLFLLDFIHLNHNFIVLDLTGHTY